MSVSTYAPTELVVAGRSRLVPLLCRTIEASGITAPDVSRTVPLIAACACAWAVSGVIRQHPKTNRKIERRERSPKPCNASFDVIIASPGLDLHDTPTRCVTLDM